MHVLDELDEPKATLRMLLELHRQLGGMNVTWLYRVMRDEYSVGRPAVDSSYRALVKAGLASVSELVKAETKAHVKVIALTSLGEEVALKIKEVEKILGDAKKSADR